MMADEVPFAARRERLLERAVAILSIDGRFPAGWLEGSLADGTADAYSDIDLYLCVKEELFDQVWRVRRDIVELIAPIVAAHEIAGVFGLGCLVEGPVKLDVFFEKESTLGSHRRVAVKRLWGDEKIFERLEVGEDRGDAAIRRALQFNVLGLLQGGTWPVRMLARGQVNTFLFNEILLVETYIVPLMLLEKDRRSFHRNIFARAKLLAPEQSAECARLVDAILRAVERGDRVAMRDVHIEIFRLTCALGRAAFARYGLEFPPRAEHELLGFFAREWPLD